MVFVALIDTTILYQLTTIFVNYSYNFNDIFSKRRNGNIVKSAKLFQ